MHKLKDFGVVFGTDSKTYSAPVGSITSHLRDGAGIVFVGSATSVGS